MNPGEILQINFQKPPPPPSGSALAPDRKARGFDHLGGGDYVDRRTGHHYENPKINGRYTWRKLSAITHAAALKEIRKKRSDYEAFKLGLSKQNPYAPKTYVQTVADLLDKFQAAGFPKKRNVTSPRGEAELRDLKAHVVHLKKYFGRKTPADLTGEDIVTYHSWRTRQIAEKRKETDQRRPGHRSVDRERATLSMAFDYAIDHSSSTGVTANPFARKIKIFADPASVQHCREFQPAHADELHQLGATLFDSLRSEVLAWQLFFEAFIGQRSHEIVRLQWDAKTQLDPGYIEKTCLFLFRSKTTKGTYPYAAIHPALRDCLAAHRHWHDRRFPNSPWYLPNPIKPKKHITPDALTKALARITEELHLPTRKSHGLRSYFVNVLRSDRRPDGTHRYTDNEIALRIGQRTQGKLIVDVYGDIPAHPLTWLPESSPPAWTRWLPTTEPVAEQLSLEL